MGRRKRRAFTTEFKAETVRPVLEGGRSIPEVARDLDLTESSLRAWVRQAALDQSRGKPGALTTAEREEVQRLRREVRDLRIEREILNISDLAPHAATLRVGLFGEFLEREDGMPGLLRTYGFRLGVRPREMDLGLLYQAVSQGQVDLVVGSATDGLIAALDLVVLEDERRYFPPYDAVPVINARRLEVRPGLPEALERPDRRGRHAENELRRGRPAPVARGGGAGVPAAPAARGVDPPRASS